MKAKMLSDLLKKVTEYYEAQIKNINDEFENNTLAQFKSSIGIND